MATNLTERQQIEAYKGLDQDEAQIARYMKGDFTDGHAISEIWDKYLAGHYGTARKTTPKFQKIWKGLIKALKHELPEPEDRVPVLYAMYMSLYRQAVAASNIKEAKGILDSIARLLGQTEDGNTIEIKPDTIKITFGTTKIENKDGN